MSDCLFCKIIEGSIPSETVFEDDLCLAFKDINPAAPVHLLIIPKEHISTLNDISKNNQAVVGHIYSVAAQLADKFGLAEGGYRVVANCNADAGQTVFHIHFHLLGGRQLGWPPG
jgi:histidine triad (HIT) family protein